MGGKDDNPVIGYHYRVAYHVGLGRGPIDAFLEFRAAEMVAWDGSAQTWHAGGKAIRKRGSGRAINEESLAATGPLTASGSIYIGKPNLFGGEKDQGGIEGPVDIMFGEADQLPNPYLQEVFGEQTAAWRGLATVAFCGGRYGAMNPMPQKPAYKIRKILKGWDGDWGEDPCWYPVKAEIWMLPETVFIEDLAFPATSAAVGPYAGVTINSGFTADDVLIVSKPAGLTYQAWSRWSSDDDPNAGGLPWANDFRVTDDNDETTAHWITPRTATAAEADSAFRDRFVALTGSTSYAFWLQDEPVHDNRGGLSLRVWKGGMIAMNPAHALYYVRTDGEKGREPYANINDSSLRAAADRLHEEGFGLCWQYDPKQDTPDSFTEHICRIIGGSFTRSLVDGQWYLDLARGAYNIESLPVVGDDDILEFRELPTTLDRAVNSVSVRYFDPERKEKIITPAVRALGLIRMFGEIHQTLDFPEIPTAGLAARVAERELRAYVTPTRTFDLVTTPRTRGIRNNQYFRLQSPRRGIADMVCIMGEQDSGTLRSGAMRRKVTQDVYSLPDTSYVEVEPGVDTRPPQNALPVTAAQVLEAPYIVLAVSMPRAELEAVPSDVGYLLAVATDPGQHLDYRLAVAPVGDDYLAGGSGRWCPTATIVEPAGYTQTAFSFTGGRHLADAVLGAPVLWGNEICRLDALDVVAGTITLGRGCADTVPHTHAAGERIWIATELARGPGEYSDGEEVLAKLLSRTATQELPLGNAPSLPLEFARRQARPYPPAGVQLNGEAYPDSLAGDVEITAAHRDRLLQADQLVDQTVADIGPEPGTTYVVRNINTATDAETYYADGITAFPHVVPAGSLVAMNRLEVYSIRDGLESWQRVAVQFSVGAVLMDGHGLPITDNNNDPIRMR